MKETGICMVPQGQAKKLKQVTVTVQSNLAAREDAEMF